MRLDPGAAARAHDDHGAQAQHPPGTPPLSFPPSLPPSLLPSINHVPYFLLLSFPLSLCPSCPPLITSPIPPCLLPLSLCPSPRFAASSDSVPPPEQETLPAAPPRPAKEAPKAPDSAGKFGVRKALEKVLFRSGTKSIRTAADAQEADGGQRERRTSGEEDEECTGAPIHQDGLAGMVHSSLVRSSFCRASSCVDSASCRRTPAAGFHAL